MKTFTIGLGIPGTLNNDTATNGPIYTGLKNGTINWPQPADNSINNIDDLWHAAINSRGSYSNAKNPAELLTAFA
jgi:type IV pilus assembly protein PilY1